MTLAYSRVKPQTKKKTFLIVPEAVRDELGEPDACETPHKILFRPAIPFARPSPRPPPANDGFSDRHNSRQWFL
jgi:hypothetical protein